MRPVAGRPGVFDSPNPQAFADGGDRGLFPGFLSATTVSPQLLEDDPFRSNLIRPLDGGLSAIRVGNAWLVVQGGADTAQRLAALAALTPGHTDLRLPQPPSRPVRARCWINIRQLPQLTIVNESNAQPPAQRPGDGECVVAASLYLNNWPLQAVLSSPDPLPAPWQAMLSIYRVPTLTVHHGSAWLQITGGSGAAQCRAVAAVTSVTVP